MEHGDVFYPVNNEMSLGKINFVWGFWTSTSTLSELHVFWLNISLSHLWKVREGFDYTGTGFKHVLISVQDLNLGNSYGIVIELNNCNVLSNNIRADDFRVI